MFKRGNSWVSDFWHNGQRYTKSHGNITKTVARERDQAFKVEVREGKHEAKAKRVLFETFADKFLDEYVASNLKRGTLIRYTTSMTVFKEHFNGKLLQAIHPLMIEQYKKARKESGIKPGTINLDLAALRSMFTKALEWGYLKTHPMNGVKQLRVNNERMWVLSPDEEERLLNACDSRIQRAKYLGDLVRFALHSGMRVEEILSLRKADVHLDKRFVLVRDTKNHENRRVPINDTLKGILKRRLKYYGSGYAFCNHKRKKIPALNKTFSLAVEQAGLKGFRFHDLRHTFGSRLGMKGFDLKTIMEIMGHKTVTMAMRYQHPTRDHKLEAVMSLDELPSNLPSSKIVPLQPVAISVG